MSLLERFLFFIVLPIVAIFCYPPALLMKGATVIGVVVIGFILLGILLWSGRSLALTFAIFMQGLNVIVRIMMIFSNSMDKAGKFDALVASTMLLGLVISLFLVLRLDRLDVRQTMIR